MSYPPAETFWLEPTDQVAWGLRRYTAGHGGFDCAHGYHQALIYQGRAAAAFGESNGRRSLLARESGVPYDDPRWPVECERGCGYRFTDEDPRQDWQELVYRRPDTGQEYTIHSNPAVSADAVGVPTAPPGAMWDAWWMPFSRGPDGICLVVRLPNGHDWMVDSQANNCTRPGEPHQCWVRHGDPRRANVTVDKNGDTCAAGAGSILAGDYHGFLVDGMLTAG